MDPYTLPLSLASAKAMLDPYAMDIVWNSFGEYVIMFREDCPADLTACFTPDLADAVAIGIMMREARTAALAATGVP